MNKNYAFIPARAGSKGIKNKNIQSVGPLNLLEMSLLAALDSEVFTKIFVSSDGLDILKCANKTAASLGASDMVKCVLRPASISYDDSTTESALKHTICHYATDIEEDDCIYILQPTSPFRNSDLIFDFYTNFEKSGSQSGFTASRITPFLWRDGLPQYDIMKRKMRQNISDDEFFYHEDGNIFAFKYDVFKNTGNRIGVNPFIYKIDDIRSIQVDTNADLEYCRYICEKDNGVNKWTQHLVSLSQR